jgi:alanine-glyoxylate transaminase/serine-glyoxylate transaminase/serine-pyruvate transaminase
MSGIAGAEMAMLDCGIKVQPGSGVGAASDYWRKHRAPAGLDQHAQDQMVLQKAA